MDVSTDTNPGSGSLEHVNFVEGRGRGKVVQGGACTRFMRNTMKNIVVCADGTWNGPFEIGTSGIAIPSNVQLLFQNLAGELTTPEGDEMERVFTSPSDAGTILQIAKYIHGIGDTPDKKARKVEGDLGLGLVHRLVRGYTFISRHFEAGDAIYIVGFSRGAYTARALAGLIARSGLLDWSSLGLGVDAKQDVADAIGMKAWIDYRRKVCRSDLGNDLDTLWHEAAELLCDVVHHVPPPRYVERVQVTAVGVWDTVGALGIPVGDDTGRRADLYEFADVALSKRVTHGFHALSIDEQRVDFTPTLWEARESVTQVLFPGAHADVGGGYPPEETGLSNGALRWMVSRLAQIGLRFDCPDWPTVDPKGLLHRQLAGTAHVSLRTFPAGLELSATCAARLAAPAAPVTNEVAGAPPIWEPYRPANLLEHYLTPEMSGVRAGVVVADINC